MRAVLIVLAVCFALCGCQSRQLMCGGVIFVDPTPLVTLESVDPTRDSPGRGFPLSPFPMPYFPFAMLRAGITGEVVVRLTIGSDGAVKGSSIVKSSQREFEAPTLAAVGKWRFFEFLDPGVKDRVGMIVDCTVRFGFEEEPNKAPEPTPGIARFPQGSEVVDTIAGVAHL